MNWSIFLLGIGFSLMILTGSLFVWKELTDQQHRVTAIAGILALLCISIGIALH